jgi:hypothetical protein
MIEYYIDGSTKDHMIGVGIVKVTEFGFIEKHHFNIEHINPSSNIAEGYSLEKTFELIKETDINKHELIDIYTDSRNPHNSLTINTDVEFTRNNFFSKQESNSYFIFIRNLYLDIISKHSKSPLYFCDKTKRPRPLIKLYYKEDTQNKKYLQDAHTLSRNYIKEELVKMELKAIKEKDKWVIVKDKKAVVAENKRPLIALSEALKQTNAFNKQIKLCDTLETLLKSTSKNKLSNESMKSAYKIIENHKLLI